MNFRWFTSSMALTLSLLFVCLGTGSVGAAEDVLRVGHVGHDHQIALYAAVEAGKGLEKDYGVYLRQLKNQEVYELYDGGEKIARVQFIRVGGGAKMPAALEQGHIDVGLGGLGPVAKFADKGSPLCVLAPLNNDGDSLVAGANVKASSWKEFISHIEASDRPVRIGYKAPMAVAYLILVRAMQAQGIRFGQEPVAADGLPVQVITVDLQSLSNALPSLESGLVDAVVVNEPMASLLVHKGVGTRVADLSTLPPEGKWKGHPCCVVAARRDVLQERGRAVESLLKVIAAGGDLVALNPDVGLAAEAFWTRTPPEVGRQSIANVRYVIRPDGEWRDGVNTWIELMKSSGHFKGAFANREAGEIGTMLLELAPMERALGGMRLRSETGKETR